jgi:hypothetical protein
MWRLFLLFLRENCLDKHRGGDQSHIVDRSGSGPDAYPGSFFPLLDLNLQIKPPGERKVHMKQPIQLTNAIPTIITSLSQSFVRHGFVLLALAGFALSLLALTPHSARAQSNVALGNNALASNTTGSFNVALGNNALRSNTEGNYNTATGFTALRFNTTGLYNTANGARALFTNTTGARNTASGYQALYSNTDGDNNTASGYQSLYSNTTGLYNTASGLQALYSNTTGSSNTASGYQALYSNTGFANTASGLQALYYNTTGYYNTASGYGALFSNKTGYSNTASGASALKSNMTGHQNTASGSQALVSNTSGYGNTAIGFEALFANTGSSNTALGDFAGYNLTTGTENIDIGNVGVAGESNTIRIGHGSVQLATYIAGITGRTASGGAAVFVDANGKLGTNTSSRRFKQDIADMAAASEALLSLRPVSFRYRPDLDPQGIPQYGLVAEEVEQVNPDLVARDEKGKAYTVRYEAVNAMLLNEFLKEHRKVKQLESKAQEQERKTQQQDVMIAKQQKQIETLTTGLQKVSGQLEVSKPAPQLVADNQ